jgi:hypothetical protein
MVHSTFQQPPHSHTLSTVCILYCTLGRGEGGGGQREGTEEGQQYTSAIKFLRPWGQQFTSWVENTNHE